MGNTVLRFVVMSDVHVKDDKACPELERLDRGMKAAWAYADGCERPGIDAIVVVGDFANHGSEQEMLNFKEVFEKNLRPGTRTLLSVASHEYGSGIPETHERMKRLFNMDPHMHITVNGYHFISVAPERGTYYGKAQQEYAFRELQKAFDDDPEKAIFFFQHAHINNTVYGSYDWGEKELIPVLMNYPQIIDFSGHSHAPINDPRNVHQEYFTCFGTGSLSYTELDEFDKYYGTVPPDCREFAQYLIVEVDEDKTVTVKAFDIITDDFFPCDRVIRPPFTPENFVYTDRRYLTQVKPYFEENTPISVLVKGRDAEITFAQAKCDEERVNDYLVTVTRKSDGRILRRVAAWSGYYRTNMPKTVTVPVPALPAGEYTATVVARGFWKNVSDNALTVDLSIE